MPNQNAIETSLRPIQLLVRSKESIELYTLPATSWSHTSSDTGFKKECLTLYQGKTTFHLTCPTGNCVYVHVSSVGLFKFNLGPSVNNNNNSNTGGEVSPFLPESQPIQLATCSPRGTFLLTWQRPNSYVNGDGSDGNLRVWCTQSASLKHSFSCKKAALTTLQWTFDERLAFHMVTNEIHIYCSKQWTRVAKVRCANISSFSLPNVKGYASNAIVPTHNDQRYLFTAFSPEQKGKPARVDLLRYPDRMGRESSTVSASSESNDKFINVPSGPALASKSLFNAEDVAVHWSPRADSALLLTQTAVDSTGESYYGSTNLFLFLENDTKCTGQGAALVVPLPPEATKGSNGSIYISAVSWIPNPTIQGAVPFIVIAGRMPALASLHNGLTGEPTFLFGKAHRNTIDVSPHGRFLVLGGYGNLAGGMDFWDRNKGKLIPRHVLLPPNGSGKEEDTHYVAIKEQVDLSVTSAKPVVGHQWSPDSRTYMVSTTSPRMNVDNGLQIYRYDGSLMEETKLPWENSKFQPDNLLSAEYVPAPLQDEMGMENGNSSRRDFFYYPDRPQSPPPRNLVELKGEAANQALLSWRQTHATGIGKVTVNAGIYVPPSARKSAANTSGGNGGPSFAERMRQEREHSAASVAGRKIVPRTGPIGAARVGPVGSTNCDHDGKSKNSLRREKQRLAKERAEREAVEAEEQRRKEEIARAEANKLDPEKRAKKLRKAIKQIELIKAKVEEGIELNDDQKEKLASEEELRKELSQLGL